MADAPTNVRLRPPTFSEVEKEYEGVPEGQHKPIGPIEVVDGTNTTIPTTDAANVPTEKVGMSQEPNPPRPNIVEMVESPNQVTARRTLDDPAISQYIAEGAVPPVVGGVPDAPANVEDDVVQYAEQLKKEAAGLQSAPPIVEQSQYRAQIAEPDRVANQQVTTSQPTESVTFIGDFGEFEIPFAHVVIGTNCIACYSKKDSSLRFTPKPGSDVTLRIGDSDYRVIVSNTRFDSPDGMYRIDVYFVPPIIDDEDEA